MTPFEDTFLECWKKGAAKLLKYGFAATLAKKEKTVKAATLWKVWVCGNEEAVKLLKVWVWGWILHKNTSLGQLFNKRRCENSKNMGFRLRFCQWKSKNRTYDQCFYVLEVVFLSLCCFMFPLSCFSIKRWSLPSVTDDYVAHFWHRAPNHSKSWFSSPICLVIACLETHNFPA